jgi:hypothetical protein
MFVAVFESERLGLAESRRASFLVFLRRAAAARRAHRSLGQLSRTFLPFSSRQIAIPAMSIVVGYDLPHPPEKVWRLTGTDLSSA